MKGHAWQCSVWVVVVGLFLLPTALLSQQPVSHVRVVRLSYVSGTVALKRSNLEGVADASVNTPIREGYELETYAGSFAEVEFENGSTARLGELSKMEFTQLALDADGNRLNGLTFEQGYGTLHFLPEHHDVTRTMVPGATLTPKGKSEFRIDFREGRVRVEVFRGSVQAEFREARSHYEIGNGARIVSSQFLNLGKDKLVEYTVAEPGEILNVHEGIKIDDWDRWAETRDRQAAPILKAHIPETEGMRYGMSDLDAYGEWGTRPGFGRIWMPYTAAGWTPYSQGRWYWDPTFGWTWISTEPWGWLPYHCGLWDYDASFGWYWMAGMPAMMGCGMWHGSLVTWYRGSGWIGWEPLQAQTQPQQAQPQPSGPPRQAQPGHGRPVRGLPGHNDPAQTQPGLAHRGMLSVVAISDKEFQNGKVITPQTSSRAFPTQGSLIERPPFQPPLVVGGNAAVRGAGFGGDRIPVSGGGLVAPGSASHGAPSPPTILMGGDVASERSLVNARQPDGMGRTFGKGYSQPIHSQLGPTLGGRLWVGATPEEVRGEGPRRGSGNSGSPERSGFIPSFRSGGGGGGSVQPAAGGVVRGGGGGEHSGAVSHVGGGGSVHGGGGSVHVAGGGYSGGHVSGGGGGGGYSGGHVSGGGGGGGYSGGHVSGSGGGGGGGGQVSAGGGGGSNPSPGGGRH